MINPVSGVTSDFFFLSRVFLPYSFGCINFHVLLLLYRYVTADMAPVYPRQCPGEPLTCETKQQLQLMRAPELGLL